MERRLGAFNLLPGCNNAPEANTKLDCWCSSWSSFLFSTLFGQSYMPSVWLSGQRSSVLTILSQVMQQVGFFMPNTRIGGCFQFLPAIAIICHFVSNKSPPWLVLFFSMPALTLFPSSHWPLLQLVSSLPSLSSSAIDPFPVPSRLWSPLLAGWWKYINGKNGKKWARRFICDILHFNCFLHNYYFSAAWQQIPVTFHVTWVSYPSLNSSSISCSHHKLILFSPSQLCPLLKREIAVCLISRSFWPSPHV